MRLIRFETVHQQSFSNSGDVLSLWSLCPSLVVANEFSTGGTLPRVVRSEKVVCSDVYVLADHSTDGSAMAELGRWGTDVQGTH